MGVYYANGDGERTVMFEGAVLADRERNYYDDSDFYVTAWDGEKLVNHEYNTTRYGGGGTASVDATPEVRATAEAWAYKVLRRSLWSAYVDELKKPKKGDMVTVVSGRKVPLGTKGRVFWVGAPKAYGPGHWAKVTTKCGLALSDSRDASGYHTDVAWTYLENVEADAGPKFRFSEAKYRLRSLRRNAVGAWMAYGAHGAGCFYAG